MDILTGSYMSSSSYLGIYASSARSDCAHVFDNFQVGVGQHSLV